MKEAFDMFFKQHPQFSVVFVLSLFAVSVLTMAAYFLSGLLQQVREWKQWREKPKGAR